MYLIDSDVFIDAKNRHYGFDFVPGFWEWITLQHSAGRVFTVQKVAEEVMAGADELATWMRARPNAFKIAPDAADQANLRALSAWAAGHRFAPAAVATFLQTGDYFLVAQAATRNYTVVTQEQSQPAATRRIKIPDACAAIGVQVMTPFAMLRAESARFVL